MTNTLFADFMHMPHPDHSVVMGSIIDLDDVMEKSPTPTDADPEIVELVNGVIATLDA